MTLNDYQKAAERTSGNLTSWGNSQWLLWHERSIHRPEYEEGNNNE